MKNWSKPEVRALEVKCTEAAYHSHVSPDGAFWINSQGHQTHSKMSS